MSKKVLRILSLLLFLARLAISVAAYQAKRQLTQYCGETFSGTSLSVAKERAQQNEFRFSDNVGGSENWPIMVTASGVMGRYVCELEHGGKRVLKARLLFND